jgi:single-strand DNA-binding protein
MQKVLLIGYLGRDPEVRYSAQGTVIAQFSVATTERWRDKSGEPQEHTEWFAVKAFGRKAEVIGEYLHKGSRVYVEGRKRTESWDDKQTGGKHYRDLVYADRVEFLDSNGNGKGNGNGNQQQGDMPGESQVSDSEIPF